MMSLIGVALNSRACVPEAQSIQGGCPGLDNAACKVSDIEGGKRFEAQFVVAWALDVRKKGETTEISLYNGL